MKRDIPHISQAVRREVMQWMEAFLHLIYPRLCICCEREAPVSGSVFCIGCAYHLSLTKDFEIRDNDFTEQFWGRIRLYSGAAMFPFVKGGRVQRLIHKIKYEGRKDVGHMLGRWVSGILRERPLFSGVQAIVPVPLHPKRKRQRGYNQSEEFGRGICDGLDIPLLKGVLRRAQHTESQTGKSRMERIENLSRAIEAEDGSYVRNKWVLLVDDVVTTGATLEACALALEQLEVGKISMLTIAKGS